MDSLLSQTLKEFEILAFDDGSVDGSIEILKKYSKRDSRVRVFLREHCGYSPHLNEGISLARGQWIARMDSDDICVRSRFQKQVDYLLSRPDVVAVGSWMELIDTNGRPFSCRTAPTSHEEIEELHLRGFGGTMPHPSLMIRTDTVRSIGGYRTELEPAEDLDLLLRLGEIGRLANIPENLIAYRIHANATSTLHRDKQNDRNRTILCDAWQRRNLEGSPVLQSHGNRTPETSEEMLDERFTKCMHSHFFGTARHYALRMCLREPSKINNWRKLIKSVYSPWRISEQQSVANIRN